MVKLSIQEERCKGCHFCVISCPKNAIKPSGIFNSSSYETIMVEEELCVKCGSCYTVCPDGVFSFTEINEE